MENQTNNNQKKIPKEIIDDLLKKDNWPHTTISDGLWKLSYFGEKIKFKIFLRLSNDWITIAVVPYTFSPEAETMEAEQLHEKLLKLNHKIHMAKFSLDTTGEVMLSLDLSTDTISESNLSSALNIISYYAEKHWDEFTHSKIEYDE